MMRNVSNRVWLGLAMSLLIVVTASGALAATWPVTSASDPGNRNVLPQRAGGLVLADFNNDGQLEAAVPGLYVAGVAVLGYPSAATAWFDAGGGPVALAAGDFDGNGSIDLAVVVQAEGGVAILTNDGTGQFARTAFYNTEAGTQAIAAVDINKDGKMDLVVANRLEGSIIRLINTGSGFTIEPPVYLPAVLGPDDPDVSSEPNALAVADINNDGWPDVVVACAGDDSVKILTNSFGLLSLTATCPAGPYPVAVAAGDLNRDGLMDLVVADREGPQVTVLLQDMTGLFTPQDVFLITTPNTAYVPPTDVALVYLDNNRSLDILCDGYSLFNDGTGHFGPAQAPAAPAPNVYAVLRQAGQAYVTLATYANATVTTSQIDDPPAAPGDIDGDGHTNLADLKLLVAAWNSTGTPRSQNWNPYADVDSDGAVTLVDLKVVVGNWGS